jgi:hypothetical protein
MFSVRRIVGGVIVLVVGGGVAAGHSYAGHGGASGDFCEFTLKQNHDLDAKMASDTLDLAGMRRLVTGAARDLRAQARTEVKPGVLTAGENLAAALSAMGSAGSAEAYARAGDAYDKAIDGIAAACNTATGQKVKVVDSPAGTKA